MLKHILLSLINLLDLFLLIAMIDEPLHSLAAGDELLEVELVGLVPGDMPQGEEPGDQLCHHEEHHDAPDCRV